MLKQEIKPYTPNFARAVDHFCIHTGGRAVLDAMETQLRLSPTLMEPSKHTLWRMGNTSSASIWSASVCPLCRPLPSCRVCQDLYRGSRSAQLGACCALSLACTCAAMLNLLASSCVYGAAQLRAASNLNLHLLYWIGPLVHG